MKIVFYYLKGKTSPWIEEAGQEYTQKISQFFTTERIAIKSKSSDREQKNEKIKAESEAILKNITPSDLLILFDEGGKSFETSIDFSNELVSKLSSKKNRIVFLIGGPYGFSTDVRKRADARWSLSPLTMNHHVAQIVALEQIYRGLAIWRNLPYHNI